MRFRTLCKKKKTPGAGVEGQYAEQQIGKSFCPYILTSSSHRKQHGLGGRSIGNGLELRVMPPQRLRHFHFRAFQDADELQGVDHGLALEMIVGDDESIARLACDFAHAIDPRRELFGGVEIVVAFVRRNYRVVAEPPVVAPPVKPYVSNGGSSLSRRPQRSPDDGLVDVAKTDAAGAQQF